MPDKDGNYSFDELRSGGAAQTTTTPTGDGGRNYSFDQLKTGAARVTDPGAAALAKARAENARATIPRPVPTPAPVYGPPPPLGPIPRGTSEGEPTALDLDKIWQATKDAYHGTSFWASPEARKKVADLGMRGQMMAAAGDFAGALLGALSGFGAGAQEGAYELIAPLSPKLAADVVSMPDALAYGTMIPQRTMLPHANFGETLRQRGIPQDLDRPIAEYYARTKPREQLLKAYHEVATQLGQDIAGNPEAEDMMRNRLAQATAGEKPLTLLDFREARNLRGGGGAITRREGPAGSFMTGVVDRREEGAGPRLIDDTYEALGLGSVPSAYRAKEGMLHKRSVDSVPLYSKAFEGGSTAPLEHLHEQGLLQLQQEAHDARAELDAANRELLLAEAAVSRAGNDVYLSNSALAARRTAQAKVDIANIKIGQIAKEQDAARDLLDQARADKSANAPGAVWSPKIQRILETPEFKEAMKEGYQIERLESAAEDRPNNAYELALIGTDEAGDPVVGKVPNMLVLNAGKKGFDAIIRSERDAKTGILSARGVAFDRARRSLLAEMDSINPNYKIARATWGGDSASADAITLGEALLNKQMPIEKLIDALDNMNESDKEFLRIGAADALVTRIKQTEIGANEAKKLIRDAWSDERIRLIFPTAADATDYVNRVAIEKMMHETKSIYGGSPTAERLERSAGGGAAGIAIDLALGHYKTAFTAGVRELEKIGVSKQNLDMLKARIMLDPDPEAAARLLAATREGLETGGTKRRGAVLSKKMILPPADPTQPMVFLPPGTVGIPRPKGQPGILPRRPPTSTP